MSKRLRSKLLSAAVMLTAIGIQVYMPNPMVGQTNLEEQQLAEAESLSQKAFELYQRGQYAEAIFLLEKALAIRTKLLGEVRTGEGIYGLRRAFVLAGSESQLISLWKVDDNATKDLMVNYYQRLKNNEGRSAALHEVQKEMLASKNYQHPYYWASFIPSGDWSAMNLNISSKN